MKKLVSVALVIILVVPLFSFFSNATASTTVGGLITSDTTWNLAQSPYQLTGPVGVESGVTLTIEPGVTIDFESYYMQVNGTLRAQGTSSSNIIFTSTPMNSQGIAFMPSSTSWSDQSISGSIIENSVFNVVPLSIQGCSPKISRNTFYFWGINIQNGSPDISDNIINIRYQGIAGITATGSPVISNNFVNGTGYQNGITASDSSRISHNVIDSCLTGGVLSGQVTFDGNTVTNSYTGVSMSGDSVKTSHNFVAHSSGEGISATGGTIQGNTIINANIGIHILESSPPSTTVLIGDNNIYDCSQNSLYLSAGSNIDATNNWWGTTDSQAISQTIHDSKNNFNVGTVNFQPFLTQPSSSAPSNPINNPNTPSATQQTSSGQPSNTVAPTIQPNTTSDLWVSSIGSSSSGPQNEMEAQILQIATIVIVALAIGWSMVGLVFAAKRKRKKVGKQA